MKISDIEKNYFTASSYIKFTNEIFDPNKKEKKLVDESDISNFVKNSGFNITCNISNKSRVKSRAR